jgi:hypothetical protein
MIFCSQKMVYENVQIKLRFVTSTEVFQCCEHLTKAKEIMFPDCGLGSITVTLSPHRGLLCDT